MFADYFTLKVGEATLKGRRLTIKEIKKYGEEFLADRLGIEESIAVIRDHVKLDDGSAFDPEELTQGQLKEVIAELVLPKEGRGISDFIGLLC